MAFKRSIRFFPNILQLIGMSKHRVFRFAVLRLQFSVQRLVCARWRLTVLFKVEPHPSKPGTVNGEP